MSASQLLAIGSLKERRADANTLQHTSRERPPRHLDIETLTVMGAPALSSPADTHLPPTWTALLSRPVNMSLAAGTGVDSYAEVIKFLLAGADVVGTTSALLRHGPEQLTALVVGLERWLEDHAFASVNEIRGRLDASRARRADLLLRSHYLRAFSEFELGKQAPASARELAS
ncbi:MAG: hypothetical protein JOY71_08925 [Acetobacteraceae bacterium]|nr:hypothetical protein [Acetobacteraceae bacterium]MBV8592567.1 hypothetical protein [Acetobacteraceae bacterium]